MDKQKDMDDIFWHSFTISFTIMLILHCCPFVLCNLHLGQKVAYIFLCDGLSSSVISKIYRKNVKYTESLNWKYSHYTAMTDTGESTLVINVPGDITS